MLALGHMAWWEECIREVEELVWCRPEGEGLACKQVECKLEAWGCKPEGEAWVCILVIGEPEEMRESSKQWLWWPKKRGGKWPRSGMKKMITSNGVL
ncbi:hypothetical protein HID58_013868 [Brassica napus]|uniref:Uncharacterized protein n=1 Tax=Brassica napus TaxID=3708 RepID=A0ABQ8DFF8_BRANA|nr:hypothetical protein HID58_013868 [Brassica napus]